MSKEKRFSVTRKILFVVILAGVNLSCTEAKDALDDRSAVVDERTAVRQYAAAANAIREQQDSWVKAYQKATALRDTKALKSAISDTVLPKLKIYRKKLMSVPTGTDVLRSTHAILVEAHAALDDQLRAFVENLSPDTHDSHRRQFAAGLSAFHRSQSRYRQKIQVYYKSIGVTLSENP